MYPAVILFHYSDPNDIAIINLNRFKYFNEKFPVVPICSDYLPTSKYFIYDNILDFRDALFYKWFMSSQKILAERYFLFEYNTVCNQDIESFYSKVWDSQLTCANYIEYSKDRNGLNFQKYKKDFQRSKEQVAQYLNNFCSIFPYSGTMLTHDTATTLIKEIISNNKLWYNKPCGLRMGTIAKMNNISIDIISDNINSFISSDFGERHRFNNQFGIYYPNNVLDPYEI